MRNVLYITFDGLTDPLGQSQILPYLSHLSKTGYNITILSLEKSEQYQTNAKRLEKTIKDAGLKWVPLSFYTFPPILGAIFNLWNTWFEAKRQHQEHKFAMVHCRSYMASLLGLRMKSLYNCKFLFDMRGFWADERVDGRIWNIQNPLFRKIYRFFKEKEYEFYSEADAIVSLTTKAREDVLIRCDQKLGHQNLAPISVIPCCTDLERFYGPQHDCYRTQRERIRAELRIPQQSLVLTYIGSLGTWYCLDEMMAFFSVFKSSFPTAIFLIVTKEPSQAVVNSALRHGIPNEGVRVTSSPSHAVPHYLAAADVGISFILPSYSKTASSPTKLGEMLAMGLPVISNCGVGDSDILAARFSIGPLVESFSDSSYRNALAQLPKYLSLPRESFRNVAQEYFSLSEGVEAYSSIYRSLLPRNP